ncbi:MAG: phage tail tip lysozyme [Gemmiger sp.]|nr:phage tail tip lysozyme [Gemmiger sp.]
MQKKMLAILLALGMAATMALPVAAQGLTPETAAETATAEMAQAEAPTATLAAEAEKNEEAEPALALPTWFHPDPLTAEEEGYSHTGLYDEDAYTKALARQQASDTDGQAGEDGLHEDAVAQYALGYYYTDNANQVYEFLRSELGMNRAQACGVMANMYTESRFNPTAYNGNDTGGTESYGLCQWNSGRYATLQSWCAANGYNYTTVEGQLRYLQHEITNTWEKRIWTVTSSAGDCFGRVPDTAQGAYVAGYTWARYFERGASTYWPSRGEYAMNDFWPTYQNYTPAPTVDPALAAQFVTRLYSVCLGRTPDDSGLANWTNVLVSGSQTGTAVAAGFVFSAEFSGKNYCNEHFVQQLYLAFLGRGYDAPGLADWVNRLETGSTREAVFNGFAGSAEFAELCKNYGIQQGVGITVPKYGTVPKGNCTVDGKEDGVTGFVKRLYSVCLNRTPDAHGLADWTGRLWSQTTSGRTVALGFVFSDEFTAKNYDNATFVKYLYKAILGREADAAGLADWTSRLATGATRLTIFDGFAGSDEFTRICNSYGIVRD